MTIVTPTTRAMREAAATLRCGGVVAFATETVYGVGCDTFNTTAIECIYALKGRPMRNPMIAHILNTSWVDRITKQWSASCDNLASRFWPGGLTIILPRHNNVPPSACGGFDTIAIRCPSHPVARQLLTEFKGPISAPSANRSGYISPTTAAHVESEFQGSITVLDGGPCLLGIESTVLSMVGTPTVLRLGSISIEELEQELGSVQQERSKVQIHSPGTTLRHYAPKSPTTLAATDVINDLDDEHCIAIVINATPHQVKQVFQMPTDPQAYAVKLYAVLRDADTLNASKIVVELPPVLPAWEAVLDRLQRSAAAQ